MAWKMFPKALYAPSGPTRNSEYPEDAKITDSPLLYTQYTQTVNPNSTRHKSEDSLKAVTHAMCLGKQMTSLELDYSMLWVQLVSVKITKLNKDLASPSDNTRHS